MEKGKWLRYTGYLGIAIILSGTIAILFEGLFGEESSEGMVLTMVLFTQNLIIILLLVYIIELMKKLRLNR